MNSKSSRFFHLLCSEAPNLRHVVLNDWDRSLQFLVQTFPTISFITVNRLWSPYIGLQQATQYTNLIILDLSPRSIVNVIGEIVTALTGLRLPRWRWLRLRATGTTSVDSRHVKRLLSSMNTLLGAQPLLTLECEKSLTAGRPERFTDPATNPHFERFRVVSNPALDLTALESALLSDDIDWLNTRGLPAVCRLAA